jgi:hypothetical protein
MAEFLQGNHLNSKLDEILEGAEQKLFLISPFIKFHSRVKEILNTKKSLDSLQIVVVFGKNEFKKEKSFSKEDFDYLSEFPNVLIKYEPRLHAKYYASESATLLSSMNLYEYSQNNNIEFGIYSEANSLLENLWTKKSVDSDAWDYFRKVVENSEIIYRREPKYEDKLLGLKKKYVRSEVDIDKSERIFIAVKTKSKVAYKSKVSKKSKEKLLSATALGKLVDKSYKDVIELMSSKGFIIEDTITAEGRNQGLDYKSNKNGDSWIVYPESLKDTLSWYL